VERRGRRRPVRGRTRRVRVGWQAGGRLVGEAAALLAVALIGTLALLGTAAEWLVSEGRDLDLLLFAVVVLGVGGLLAAASWGWLRLRPVAAARWAHAPLALALGTALAALGLASRPAFTRDVASVRAWIGGPAQARRLAVAHQVYAAYRRTDLVQLRVVLERARVYERTVIEAAAAYDIDPEILMGVGAAESSFYPRDSADGGRGLFQITAPPAGAVADVRARLHVERLDLLNQHHNAMLAAATLRTYLDQMNGDMFLGLLAYNIGPRNGGLVQIMRQYGARDFVTIQPYLQHLPRDYPIRVLSAALAFRLWRREGRLPRYEEGTNAQRIQRVGIPGLRIG